MGDEKSQDSDEPDEGGLADKLGTILLVITTVLYASGYLVVFVSSQRLGISDPVEDVLKAKYIQVGAYCDGTIFFFASIGYAVSAILRRSTASIRDSRTHFSRFVMVWMFMVGLLAQGVLVRAFAASTMLMSAMIAYLLIALAAGLIGRLNGLIVGFLLLPLSLIVIWTCYAIHHFGNAHPFWTSPPNSPCLWLVMATVLLFLLCFFLGRVCLVLTEIAATKERKIRWLWYSITIPLLVFGSFDAVVGFAVVVYPFIPGDKGGGNFQFVPQVTLQMTKDSDIEPPVGPLVILLESSDSYYVTEANDSGQSFWGKLGHPLPSLILQIPRHEIAKVEYRQKPEPIPAPHPDLK